VRCCVQDDYGVHILVERDAHSHRCDRNTFADHQPGSTGSGGGGDELVTPLVVYGVFPTALIFTTYLMYRYGRQIADFIQSISL
jgi:hypothetical protein